MPSAWPRRAPTSLPSIWQGKLPPFVPYNPATPDDLAETVRLVESTGRRILASIVDTRDFDGLGEAVDDGVAELGRLDIIVANAGISAPQAWNEITPESFRVSWRST
jgi:NAD(P)-dependent dehydrogenase (short-subunit alcohol dehydrogenase family)